MSEFDYDVGFELQRKRFNENTVSQTFKEQFGISASFIKDDELVVKADNSITDTPNGTYVTEVGRETVYEQIGGSDGDLQPLKEYVNSLEDLRRQEAEGQSQRIENLDLTDEEAVDQAIQRSQEQAQQAQAQQNREQRRRNAEVVPKLVEVDDNGNKVQELQPDVVSRMGGTLPFDADSVQLQDGQTVTDERGDTNLRLNMEFKTSKQGFEKLISMRDSGNRIDLVSATYTKPATFDQIKFDRIADANGVVFADGESRKEARYAIQLQSKEQSEDDSLIQPFSSDE